jgi:hypothetical protein
LKNTRNIEWSNFSFKNTQETDAEKTWRGYFDFIDLKDVVKRLILMTDL